MFDDDDARIKHFLKENQEQFDDGNGPLQIKRSAEKTAHEPNDETADDKAGEQRLKGDDIFIF